MYLRKGDTHKIVVNGEPVHFGKKFQLEFWKQRNERPGVYYQILPLTAEDLLHYADPLDLEDDIYGRFPKTDK